MSPSAGWASPAIGQIDQGTALAGEAGDAINVIQVGTQQVVSVLRQITESLAESRGACQSVTNQTESVVQVAEECSRAVQQSGQVADEIILLGEEVRATIES